MNKDVKEFGISACVISVGGFVIVAAIVGVVLLLQSAFGYDDGYSNNEQYRKNKLEIQLLEQQERIKQLKSDV